MFCLILNFPLLVLPFFIKQKTRACIQSDFKPPTQQELHRVQQAFVFSSKQRLSSASVGEGCLLLLLLLLGGGHGGWLGVLGCDLDTGSLHSANGQKMLSLNHDGSVL